MSKKTHTPIAHSHDLAHPYVHTMFAPVVPVRVAAMMAANTDSDAGDCIRDIDTLGDYHLLLAHDVVKNKEAYRAVYGTRQFQTIIMDNSVIELGHPVEKEVMIEALSTVANETAELVFVLPDHLLNRDKTIGAVRQALMDWAPAILEAFAETDCSIRMMAVPQGDNIGEWVECVEALAAYESIGWVGIPRNFREKIGGARIQAIQIAAVLRPDWNIHLLGFSDDLHDDIMSCHMSSRFGYCVRGIDSAVPIRMAMREGQRLTFSNQNHYPRGDWWDNPGEWTPLVDENVEAIRKWIR